MRRERSSHVRNLVSRSVSFPPNMATCEKTLDVIIMPLIVTVDAFLFASLANPQNSSCTTGRQPMSMNRLFYK